MASAWLASTRAVLSTIGRPGHACPQTQPGCCLREGLLPIPKTLPSLSKLLNFEDRYFGPCVFLDPAPSQRRLHGVLGAFNKRDYTDGVLLKWYYNYCADWSDGGAADDVRKFHAVDITFYLQPNCRHRKFARVHKRLSKNRMKYYTESIGRIWLFLFVRYCGYTG